MFRTKLLSLFAMLAVLFSCQDKHSERFRANVPIYKSLAEWRSESFSLEAARTPRASGKIYLYQNYLLLNEPHEGLHIFDNTDPNKPINLGFLPVRGNVDMAVRNDQLYLDAFTDLLTFSISDITQPQLICRLNDAFTPNFPYHYPHGYDPDLPVVEYDPAKGVIVGWEQKEVTHDVNTTYYHGREWITFDATSMGAPNAAGPSSVGVGGSMAQFTIYQDHLYTLEPRQLTAYDLRTSDCPERKSDLTINREAETIFPARDHLFLGTTTGMLIYQLDNPGAPVLLSEYNHINACDPVVVQNDRAYVTLRTGNRCWGNVNQLLVIDVSDLSNPSDIATYNLTNPHGLGIDGKLLFVCDGSDGLKIFDAVDDQTILQNEVARFPQIDAYDVIPYNDLLISVAADGVAQYDYSDPQNIKLLSQIAVQ